jgi:hypothetical protein
MSLMRLRLEIAPHSLLPGSTQEEPLEKLLEFINENEASGSIIKTVLVVSSVSANSYLIYVGVRPLPGT